MSTWTLQELAKKMADIDYLMFSTRAENGQLAARPMSNNEDVDYDGSSWFFTWSDARMVDDIRRDAAVGLALQGKSHLFGAPPLFISVEGRAELITDQAAFEEHAGAALHFLGDVLRDGGAAVAVGSVAQRGRYQFMIGHHQRLGGTERHAKQRPEFAAPGFDILVEPQRPHLQQVAHQRPGTRTGQVGNAP